jgi:hypothetical protein
LYRFEGPDFIELTEEGKESEYDKRYKEYKEKQKQINKYYEE